MRNRWFHRPRFHSLLNDHEKKATWLELFYDLIFVAAFIQLGNGLSEWVAIEGFLGFAAVFVPMWVAWTGFTLFQNRFTIDDFTHRLIVFVQMFSVGAMAITAPSVLSGEPMGFALSYAVAQAMVALLYFRAYVQVDKGKAYALHWGTIFGVGAVVWLISAFVPSPYCYFLWAVGILLVLSAPVSKRSRALDEELPLDQEHLSERFGLLTLIVLGESFVKVLTSLSDGGELTQILQASFTLSITCCVWWIYFDDVAGSHLKKGRARFVVWFFAHLPLQLGATTVGVAIKKAVHFDTSIAAPAKYRWLLCGALAGVMLAVALIDSVTARRQAELSDRARVVVRSVSAASILVLAPAGGSMNAGLFLSLVAAVCVAQVLFDMMMAPLEAEPEHEAHDHKSTAEGARERMSSRTISAPRTKRRRDLSETVRKGTPSELRQDLYFYFIEGSWWRLIASMAFVGLMSNVIFAALYILQPGSVAEVADNSFADAFFFSVQTMSTIGYGGMSPITEYGHVVVTIEAAFGVLGAALATGVIFAKLSRPTSSVLFSQKAIVVMREGVPSFHFRVGNARGNEIADATISVTALVDEITPEGHHLRRVQDMALVRSNSPLFMLSWLVMHPITDDSPLAGVDWDSPKRLIAITAVMIGHDGTYMQNVHARYVYYPEDILFDHNYVDVLHELEDGRLMIDYTHFHETVPVSGGASVREMMGSAVAAVEVGDQHERADEGDDDEVDDEAVGSDDTSDPSDPT